MKTVAVIDTGIDKRKITNNNISTVTLNETFGSEDEIGHGTAIISLYQEILPDYKIYSFKVFQDYETDVEEVIRALEYIYYNLEVELINLSIGIHIYSKKLENICLKLYKKGIVLLSAFDKSGYLSYPAAFDFSIGVSSSDEITKVKNYILVENSPIDILGYSGSQVVDWINDEKRIVIGNSFILPYIAKSIFLAKRKSMSDKETIKYELKKNASKSITFNKSLVDILSHRKSYVKKIKKTVIFPINKETINLFINKSQLNFEILNVYDYKYSSKLGQKLNDFSYKRNLNDIKIRSIENLDWTGEFDTFILGHVVSGSDKLDNLLILDILKKCLKYKKNIVVFDDLDMEKYSFVNKFEEEGLFFYTPNIARNSSSNTFGELWYNNIPVLCVAGTSSKQGKFTLQLEISKQFTKKGYKMGRIGTEPNAELLNFDYSYPNGFGIKKRKSDSEEILDINQLVHSLEDKDIILIGTQSQLVPYFQGHVNSMPLTQRNILLGAQPDLMVLCVNYYDSLEYIYRTIKYAEAFHELTVIALVIYPLKRDIDERTGNYSETKLSTSELKQFKKRLGDEFKLPVFVNGSNIEELVEICIDFF